MADQEECRKLPPFLLTRRSCRVGKHSIWDQISVRSSGFPPGENPTVAGSVWSLTDVLLEFPSRRRISRWTWIGVAPGRVKSRHLETKLTRPRFSREPSRDRLSGTPIAILVRNKDARPEAYTEMAEKFRPSHADYTYQAKYGIRNWQGGGRSSARETIGRVAAAAIAKKVLAARFAEKLEIVAYVKSIQDITAEVDPETVKLETVESNIVRTGDPKAAESMIELVKKMRKEGNSVGGVVECAIRNCPVGLGVPVFDRLEADLAKAMMSLPATKGFEIGSGFAGTGVDRPGAQ